MDLPAVSPGATPAWLRGFARGADLLLLVVDLDSDPMAALELVGSELAALQVGPAAPGRNAGEQETRESRPALVVGTKLDLLAAAKGPSCSASSCKSACRCCSRRLSPAQDSRRCANASSRR